VPHAEIRLVPNNNTVLNKHHNLQIRQK